jgi:polyhydroxybutyrate depolymerase
MNSVNSDVDDLGFVEELINYFESNLNTNPQKRYLSGFSNGGYLSHKIASESEMCIAAIATVSGNMSTTT